MLTAYQIDALRDKSSQLLDPVIDFLIEDIAKRVSEAGQLTGTASYQVWRLQKLGVSQREIKKEIQKRLKVSQREVEQLLTQAAETGYNFDLSRFPNKRATPFVANTSIQQILDTAVKMAQEDLLNITQTIGFICPDGEARPLTKAYQSACDFAFTKVATGAQDFHSALRDATRGLAEKGILSIDYESGAHTSLEAAVRRNIMGGLGIMQEQISQQNHDDLGCDGWEISAHSGSAPDHEPIQGKQYPDKVYKRLNDSLKRRIGTLNCGHAASPIIMGVNEPQYTPAELEKFRQENEEGVTVDGKHYTKYEATQRQRGLERAARKQKRRILIDEAAGDSEKLQQDQIKLVRIRQEYKRFSDAAGLRMQHERMNTAGFTWKHGKDAEKVTSSQRNAQITAPKNRAKQTMPTESADPSVKIELKHQSGLESWSKDARKALYSAEYGTVGKKYEVARLYNTEGKQLFKKNGTSKEVTFTDGEIRQMRDGTLTHNHPNGSCFSPEDINMLRRGKLLEIRAATPQGVYRLRKPDKWSKEISTLEKIDDMYYNIDAQISPAIYAKVAHGDITYAQADLMSQEAVLQEFAKRYAMEFELIPWDDIRREIK